MQNNIKVKVDYFCQNLDMLVEDQKLTRQKVQTDLYFDCHDYIALILGMYRYYKPQDSWDIKNFSGEDTLVHCLASANWLGEIQLLPPHCAEFLNLMNHDFGLPIYGKNPRNLALRFLHEIGINIDLSASITKLKELSDEQKLVFLRDTAGSARRWFKAIQCIKGTWRTRLIKWIETYPHSLDLINFNFKELMEKDEYLRLKAGFDYHRIGLTYNNFSDAVALTSLISRLDKFKNHESKQLPLFFDQKGMFLRVVKETGLLESFEYKSLDGKVFNILRDSHYFILRAALSTNLLPGTEIPLEFIQQDIAKIEEAQGPLDEGTVDEIDKIKVGGRSLGEIIDSLEKLSFFESVVVPFASQDLKIAQEELEKAAKQFVNKDWKAEADKAIKKINKNLRQSVSIYSDFYDLWRKMNYSLIRLQELNKKIERRKVQLGGHRILDFLLQFGLIRFSFPESVNNRINKVLGQFAKEDPECERRALVELFNALNEVAGEAKDTSNFDILFLAGTLWSLELNQEIVERLKSYKELWVQQGLTYFPLYLVFIAAMLKNYEPTSKTPSDKSISNVLEVKSCLDELEEIYKIAMKSESVNNRDLEIGMAYLYFHLFLLVRKLQSSLVKDNSTLAEYGTFRSRAIELAKCAWINYERKDAKSIYALNQYLYYMIEGFTDNLVYGEDIEIQYAAAKLLEYQNRSDLWQYRFDDTLAQHFERLASKASDEEEWKRKINQAKLHLDAAMEESIGDREVIQYASSFENRSSMGFRKTNNAFVVDCPSSKDLVPKK